MKWSKKFRKKFRERIAVSQLDMARYLGISPSLFAMWEQGHRSLPAEASQKYIALEIALGQHRDSKETG